VLLLEQRESERMSRRSDNPLAKVIVRNYPLTTPEKELRDMFEKIGKIDDFFMPQYKDTRKPRGFFFVQYRKEEDAHDAIKNLNGNDIGGMKLAIEMVRGDKRDRDRGGRDSWRGGDRDRSRRRSRSPIRGRRRSPNRDRDGHRDWDNRGGYDPHGPPGQEFGRTGYQGIPPVRRALLDPPGPPPGMQGPPFPPHDGMGPPGGPPRGGPPSSYGGPPPHDDFRRGPPPPGDSGMGAPSGGGHFGGPPPIRGGYGGSSGYMEGPPHGAGGHGGSRKFVSRW
jgi:hypothetical protein